MLQNRVATLKSINIVQVIDIHIFTKVKSVKKNKSNFKSDLKLNMVRQPSHRLEKPKNQP